MFYFCNILDIILKKQRIELIVGKPFDGTFKNIPEKKQVKPSKPQKDDNFIKILLIAVLVSALFSGGVIFVNYLDINDKACN